MTDVTRRTVLQASLLALTSLPTVSRAATAAPSWPLSLIQAARAQIGVTTLYDPAYVRLTYPGGDVPPDRGVCTDVVIRAYRRAFGLDLQALLHEDMKANFAAYPKAWGMKAPDPNIDHRRVPNLAVYFTRRKAALPLSEDFATYRPGDLVTQMLPGNLTHIVIVSSKTSTEAPGRPLVIQNIGAGASEDDTLFAYQRTGHYRFAPVA
ncbi:DUF1287 domain-containing protein [Rhizobium sp. P38BS-XIX]|uniref:DUF1287 domain-containing protein n=1 Tax=Rhizobium sp. P38BS-XIX TaxID=2726740 RepID=UPI0014568274|nr:DUF1287 domain-containing protein [Rhizobium sp. P38BS-XIX]NLS01433.1 DUF1287 domain-containing protein [Rhizobium sp. P38BS-XIX]